MCVTLYITCATEQIENICVPSSIFSEQKLGRLNLGQDNPS